MLIKEAPDLSWPFTSIRPVMGEAQGMQQKPGVLEPYGMYWNIIIHYITTFFASQPSDLFKKRRFLH